MSKLISAVGFEFTPNKLIAKNDLVTLYLCKIFNKNWRFVVKEKYDDTSSTTGEVFETKRDALLNTEFVAVNLWGFKQSEILVK